MMKVLLSASILWNLASAVLTADWIMLMRSTPATGHNILDVWSSNSPVMHDVSELWSDDPVVKGLMKSPQVDSNWDAVEKIRIELLTAVPGNISMWMEFDARGSNKRDWFTASRMLSSSYGLSPQSGAYFTMRFSGSLSHGRQFYVANPHTGCGNDSAWLTILGAKDCGPCDYDKIAMNSVFRYSALPQSQSAFDLHEADLFIIYATMPGCGFHSLKQGPTPVMSMESCAQIGVRSQGSPMRILSGMSKTQCNVYCMETQYCQSVNYNEVNRQCELMSACVIPSSPLVGAPGYEFWSPANC